MPIVQMVKIQRMVQVCSRQKVTVPKNELQVVLNHLRDLEARNEALQKENLHLSLMGPDAIRLMSERKLNTFIYARK